MALFEGNRRRGGGRPSGPRRRGGIPRRRAYLGWDTLEARWTPAATSTWAGAISGSWSDAGNWQGDVLPATGDDLSFPSGASNLTNTNDLTSPNSFGNLTLSGSGYTIGTSGSIITLSGAVDSSQASGSNSVNLPISFGTNTADVAVDNSGASLGLGGLLTGSGGLTKSGAGELDLSGDNTYTGTTTVSAGTLDVDGNQGNSPVTIATGATLGGSGIVGAITSNSGTIQPGGTSPGILTSTGALTLGAGSTFSVALNGDTAGTDYGQLAANGTVTLNNATLNVTAGFTPTGNDQFTIIKNTSGSAVVGTFNNDPEGTVLTISGQPYKLTYLGGSGHDVVLTHLLGSTTTLSSSSSSVSYGQTVTLTADVASTSTGTPTGTVEFFNGTTQVGASPLTGGVATLTDVVLPAGTDSLTAVYQGDSSFVTSTSSAVPVTVSQASSTTTLASTPNPSGTGDTVALTATVKPVSPATSAPTGTVQFFNGTTSLGTGTLSSGTATLSTTALNTEGTFSLTAFYEGDSNFTSSTSTAVSQSVLQGTTTTVASSPNPTVFGENVALTANVSATTAGVATPTGSVEFFSGTTMLGGAVLSDGVGTFDTSSLPTGADSITAQYTGNSTTAASTSAAITHTVNQSGSSTTLTTSPNPSLLGQSVTLTATVAAASPGAGTPTGTVQFFSGTTSLGTGTLSGGVATLSTTALATGSDSVTAQYQGDTNFTGSTSTAVAQTVNQSNATVGLTVTTAGPVAFQAVKFTAVVSANNGSTTTPTGTVNFYQDGSLIGSGTLSNGTATFVTSSLPVGRLSITAVYQGDSNFTAGAASSPLPMIVGDQNQQYINQVYIDVLGVPADQQGLQYWTTKIEQGTTRKQFVRTLVESPQAVSQAIATTYANLVGKAPTAQQIAALAGASRGPSHVILAAKVLGSNDYFQARGGGTVDGWITALYQDVLDSTPTAADTARITSSLSQGVSRVNIAQGLLQTPQGKDVRITGLFQATLGRSPIASELRLYSGLLGMGAGNNKVIISLLSSEEYYAMFPGYP